MNVGKRIKILRKELGISADELGTKLGKDRSTIFRYENGDIEKLPIDILEQIADALHTTPQYLMGWEEPPKSTSLPSGILPLPRTRSIPILGEIACGDPIDAVQNFDGETRIPEDIDADYALRCKGDSMQDFRILDGDIVYIKNQPTVENGEIAAVLIDNEATLKRFFFDGKTVTLVAGNPKYHPFVFSGEALSELRVLGKAVGFTSANV